MLGGMAGSYLGAPSAGASVGSSVAAKLSKLIGTGDYAESDGVAVNSLFPNSQHKQTHATASFSTVGETVHIKHREYIEDVFAGPQSSFSIQGYSVNPGLASTFQYLSSIAQNFEEYIFHGLVFEFITTTSPYSTQPNVGSVIMAMQYDAATPAFTSKPQMENSDFAISAAPYKSIMYGVECANQAASAYYVRLDDSGTQPVNLTDIGTFFVALQNTQAYPEGTSLGELWVSYDVEFRRPHISPARFGHFHYWWNGSVPDTYGFLVPPTSGGSSANPGSVAVGSLSGANISASADIANSVVISFPNANIGDTYSITVAASNQAVDWRIPPLIVAGSGLMQFNLFCNYTASHSAAVSTVIGYNGTAGIVNPPYSAALVTTQTVEALDASLTVSMPEYDFSAQSGPVPIGFDIFVVNLGNGLSTSGPPFTI